MIPDDGATVDYTLNIPVTDATNFGDPLVAVNALDGWSTTQPMLLEVLWHLAQQLMRLHYRLVSV